jgi:predicted dehydrogenase
MSGESRAIADIGSHWCDLVQFITGLTITRVMADLRTVHKTRMKPKKEVETYSGKVLEPSDYEPQPINTEDYASVLFELSNGAHGVFTVSQVSAGRKNRLHFEIDGSNCAVAWDQERPNEMWIGCRDKANEILAKDPALLDPVAREFAHYPGGHTEGYPVGLKNMCQTVYRAVQQGSMPADPDWSTFVDGHKEVAICEAVLTSHKAQRWVDVQY